MKPRIAGGELDQPGEARRQIYRTIQTNQMKQDQRRLKKLNRATPWLDRAQAQRDLEDIFD